MFTRKGLLLIGPCPLLLSKVRTIAAFSYRMAAGKPINHPNPNLSYCNNFLHMMFSEPYREYEPNEVVERALSLFLVLHADHEQNCSTLDGEGGRQLPRQPIQFRCRRCLRTLGTASWRCKRGSDPDA